MAKTLRVRQDEIHSNAKAHGWWDGVSPEDKLKLIPEKLLLIIAEVAEATEEYRDGKMDTYLGAGGKPEGFWVEVADAVIRILDLCGVLELDIANAITEKLQYNSSRLDHKVDNRLAAGGKAF